MINAIGKPDGLTVLLPPEAEALLLGLDVADFHGVGPATARKLGKMGIHTGADLRAADAEMLGARFGRTGLHFWRIAHGWDDRPVQSERKRKSVGTEETYGDDLTTLEAVRERLTPLAESVEERLERAGGFAGRTVVLKLKFAGRMGERSQVITRRMTLPAAVHDAPNMRKAAVHLLTSELLHGPFSEGRGVRLAGITVTELERCRSRGSAAEIAGGVSVFHRALF